MNDTRKMSFLLTEMGSWMSFFWSGCFSITIIPYHCSLLSFHIFTSFLLPLNEVHQGTLRSLFLTKISTWDFRFVVIEPFLYTPPVKSGYVLVFTSKSLYFSRTTCTVLVFMYLSCTMLYELHHSPVFTPTLPLP